MSSPSSRSACSVDCENSAAVIPVGLSPPITRWLSWFFSSAERYPTSAGCIAACSFRQLLLQVESAQSRSWTSSTIAAPGGLRTSRALARLQPHVLRLQVRALHLDGGPRRLHQRGLEPAATFAHPHRATLARALVSVDRYDDARAEGPLAAGTGPSGSVTTKLAPRPGALSTSIVPWCSATAFCVIASPSPEPGILPTFAPRWNGSKIACWSSSGMPMPW